MPSTISPETRQLSASVALISDSESGPAGGMSRPFARQDEGAPQFMCRNRSLRSSLTNPGAASSDDYYQPLYSASGHSQSTASFAVSEYGVRFQDCGDYQSVSTIKEQGGDDCDSFAWENVTPTLPAAEALEVQDVINRLSKRRPKKNGYSTAGCVSADTPRRMSKTKDSLATYAKRDKILESGLGLQDALHRFRTWEEGHSVSFRGRTHQRLEHCHALKDDDAELQDDQISGPIHIATCLTPDTYSPSVPSNIPAIENLDIVEEQEKELLRLAIDRSKHETCASSVSSARCLSVDSSIWNSSQAASACFSLSEPPPPPPTSKTSCASTECHRRSRSSSAMSASSRVVSGLGDFSTSENEEQRMLLMALERSLHEPSSRTPDSGLAQSTPLANSSFESLKTPSAVSPDERRLLELNYDCCNPPADKRANARRHDSGRLNPDDFQRREIHARQSTGRSSLLNCFSRSIEDEEDVMFDKAYRSVRPP